MKNLKNFKHDAPCLQMLTSAKEKEKKEEKKHINFFSFFFKQENKQQWWCFGKKGSNTLTQAGRQCVSRLVEEKPAFCLFQSGMKHNMQIKTLSNILQTTQREIRQMSVNLCQKRNKRCASL